MRKAIYLLLFGVFFSIAALAQSSQPKGESVPPVMYGFLSQIMDLQPYLFDENAFTAEENKIIVGSKLQQFSDLTQQLKKHDRLKTPGFKTPARTIMKQLNDVNEAYQAGHRSYAWRSLRSTLHSCSQCHAQVTQKSSPPVWNFDEKKLPKDPYERADFWFVIRSYDRAQEQFEKVIRTYGKEHKDQFKLKKSLKGILAIALRIKQSPDQALTYLNQIKNLNSFPKYLMDEVQTWKNELANLKTLPPMDPKTVSVKDLENLIEDLFRSAYPIPREGRSKEVAMEYGSGLLFEFVNHRPKEATQRMFYWLGVSTIELDRFDFTSFGDSFLKECIEEFPSTPISQECYVALKDNWVFGYSGSSGVFLPKSYKDELKRLEQILNR